MIQSPDQLKKLSVSDLEALAQDVRQRILSVSLKNGGHLGASLGSVELAIALHAVFESPKDSLVWDVGHQAYAHKLLTGRWKSFDTLRKLDGISGFLSRDESEHDIFGAGHSSTSVSAALGVARAKFHTKCDDWTVAIIGDGGLTAGLAFEALNNLASAPSAPLLIVLNDNQMSISENVGSISTILTSGKAQAFFEIFGATYFGPVDGHDMNQLTGTLRGIRENKKNPRPIVLHVLTQKGKGYYPAEESPAHYHGVSPIVEKVAGAATTPTKKSYSDIFGDTMVELAKKNPKLCAITAAMSEGTGLRNFANSFPDRFYDVGIAEAHAVTFAAGIATQGMKPVVAIYSTFLQRALDSIIHDVALQKLPVVFAIDRAGVVGADGPTHHGAFDLVYLGMIPGMTITSPSTQDDLRNLFTQSMQATTPFAIRYPRGSGPETAQTPLKNGVRWHFKSKNPELIVVALGTAMSAAEKAFTETPNVSLVSTVYAKPFSKDLLAYLDENKNVPILTIEEGAVRGGFGEALLLGRTGQALGYSDHFITHGSVSELNEREGLSPSKIKEAAKKYFKL